MSLTAHAKPVEASSSWLKPRRVGASSGR